MTSTQSPVRTVHTTTVTPAMRDARRALEYAGGLSFAAAVWLMLGLSFCSVNPELSTSADHILGSLTHVICSSLITSVGIMSFSVVLVIARLGMILWSTHLPLIARRDLIFYGLFILIASTHLQLALDLRVFGAPIGGMVGEFFAFHLQPFGLAGAQGVCCLLLFAAFYVHARQTRREDKGETSEQSSLWSDALSMEAQPVKSLNANQQQIYTHILGQVDELPPEFEEKAHRFESVDSFYDDLSHEAAASGLAEEGAQKGQGDFEPIFSFDFEGEFEEPKITQAHSARLKTPSTSQVERSHRSEQSGPRLTHPEYPRKSEEAIRSSSSGLESRRGDALVSRTSSQSDVHSSARTKVDSSAARLSLRASLSPIEHLSQEVTPRVSREMILQKGFDAQGLTLALTATESGKTSDRYIFVSPIPPPSPIHEVSELLNQHIRRSLGRTEPPLILISYPQNEKFIIEVTWPRRDRLFVETTEAMKVIRELERRKDLYLYLGEQPNGDKALLPFDALKSILITGGDGVSADRGLNLILTNLVYQSSPDRLRLIVVDKGEQHATLSKLPHLYCPILDDAERITDMLRWLPIEYRRRRTQMGRVGVYQFADFQSRVESETRIICLIPELAQLTPAQSNLLMVAMEKIAQSSYDVGIHFVINTRQWLSDSHLAIAEIVEAQFALAAGGLEEANHLRSPGAEWLLPQDDGMIRIGSEPFQRIHTWLLSHASYNRILSVLANASQLSYINATGELLDPKLMRSKPKATSSLPVIEKSQPQQPRRALVSTLTGINRSSESSSLPPV